MSKTQHRLAFEQPICELEARLAKLETSTDNSVESADEIRRLRAQLRRGDLAAD